MLGKTSGSITDHISGNTSGDAAGKGDESLLAQAPQQDEALAAQRRAAHLLAEQGDSERAIVAYRTILSTHPHDSDAQLALATIYRKQGQTNRAALSYEMAAQSLASHGQLVESLAVAQQIVEMSPENVARRLRLADQYAKANLLTDSAREFAAAATYLRSVNRRDECSRVLERLHVIESKLAKAVPPPSAVPAVTSAPDVSEVRTPHSELAHGDASVLIAEADSYLRLGLLDKAVAHLSAALGRNPFLRKLREPLVQLLVAQQKPKQAVTELWELFKQSNSPHEKLRYLRYILRLDGQDQAARAQLSAVQGVLAEDSSTAQAGSAARDASGDAIVSVLSVSTVDGVLIHALEERRPATDQAVTSVIQLEDPLHRNGATESSTQAEPDVPPPPSAQTRPGAAEIEAIAEEIALSSRSFQDELEAVDRCVQDGHFEDALRHLNILAACYPHSQSVQAQIQELECMLEGPAVVQTTGPDAKSEAESSPQSESSEAAAESSMPVSLEIAAAIRALRDPLAPSQTTPSLPALISGAKSKSVRTTMEVDPSDIEAELNLQSLIRQSSGHPPPPPHRASGAPAAVATAWTQSFRNGLLLRGRGQLSAALVEFEKALLEPSLAARAALLMGRCLRDLQRIPEAIEIFMRGANLPKASETDLSELFYELGETHAQVKDAKEAILFFRLSLGKLGRFRDAEARIASLQQSIQQKQ